MDRARGAPFKIPARLYINGKRWLVLREKDLGDCDRDVAARREFTTDAPDGMRCHGITYRDVSEIHLSGKQSPREEAFTFVHELLHACSKNNLSAKMEEDFIMSV